MNMVARNFLCAYENGREISYYSDVQFENLTAAIQLMDDMVKNIELLAKQNNDKRMLLWVKKQIKQNVYYKSLLKRTGSK